MSANYFDVLGVPLVQGRTFTAQESRPGQDIPVVVASYAYWQRTGFDPALMGKTIRVNQRESTVVGFTPRGFTGTMSVFGAELFFPLGVFDTLANDFQGDAARSLQRPDAYNLFLVAREIRHQHLPARVGQLARPGVEFRAAVPHGPDEALSQAYDLPTFRRWSVTWA